MKLGGGGVTEFWFRGYIQANNHHYFSTHKYNSLKFFKKSQLNVSNILPQFIIYTCALQQQ